ncbi:MAG: hypothetical protein IT325_09890 [Anaerolineae bacterium]|nr:hypothetical protein [Anaerolineae bacterium]
MSAISAAVVGSAVVSAYSGNRAANTQAAAARDASAQQIYAANRSADLQHDATIRGQNLQREMFDRAAGYSQPYRERGAQAIETLSGELSSGQLSKNFDASMMAQYAPAYQFQLKQGLGQAENMANRMGGLVGGNALQGLNTYAQNYAQTAYQQAFSNYQTEQANRYSRLMGVAQLGQNAAAGTGSGAIATGQSMANLGLAGAQGMSNSYATGANNASGYLTSGAAAQAAGQVSVGNSLSGGLNSYLGWNYLYGRPGGASAAPATTTMPGSLSLNQ